MDTTAFPSSVLTTDQGETVAWRITTYVRQPVGSEWTHLVIVTPVDGYSHAHLMFVEIDPNTVQVIRNDVPQPTGQRA